MTAPAPYVFLPSTAREALTLYADVFGSPSFRCEGMMFSLLGAAAPATLHEWFKKLTQGGQVVDDLQARPWGATDGQVIDRHGLHWLIGYEHDTPDQATKVTT